jgi:hypothetical protein
MSKKKGVMPNDAALVIIESLKDRFSTRHHFSDKDVSEVKELLSDLEKSVGGQGQETDDDNLETEEGKQ